MRIVIALALVAATAAPALADEVSDNKLSIHFVRDGDAWSASFLGRKLTPPQLYALVGRDDFPTTYYVRGAVGGFLVVAGPAAILGGIVHYFHTSAQYPHVDEHYIDGYSTAGVLGGLAVTGIAVMLLVHRNPLSADEAEAMVHDYNAHGPARQLACAPYADRQGGGLAITGAF